MKNKKLSKVKRIKTNHSCVVKKTPIKITQADVDELDLQIRKNQEEAELRREAGLEYAKDIVMK